MPRATDPTCDNVIDLNAEGTYAEAPPVLAVRSLGKGRIVCYPFTRCSPGPTIATRSGPTSWSPAATGPPAGPATA